MQMRMFMLSILVILPLLRLSFATNPHTTFESVAITDSLRVDSVGTRTQHFSGAPAIATLGDSCAWFTNGVIGHASKAAVASAISSLITVDSVRVAGSAWKAKNADSLGHQLPSYFLPSTALPNGTINVIAKWNKTGSDTLTASSLTDNGTVLSTTTDTIKAPAAKIDSIKARVGVIDSLTVDSLYSHGTMMTKAGRLRIATIPAAGVKHDSILVANADTVSYRSAANIAADIGAVAGTGTQYYLPVWGAGGTVLGNSNILYSGGNLGFGVATMNYPFVFGSNIIAAGATGTVATFSNGAATTAYLGVGADLNTNFLQFGVDVANARCLVNSSGIINSLVFSMNGVNQLVMSPLNAANKVSLYIGGNSGWLANKSTGAGGYNQILCNLQDTPTWKYISSDYAALLQMYNGAFNFYTATSGTAGGAATLHDVFDIANTGQLTAAYYSTAGVVQNASTTGLISSHACGAGAIQMGSSGQLADANLIQSGNVLTSTDSLYLNGYGIKTTHGIQAGTISNLDTTVFAKGASAPIFTATRFKGMADTVNHLPDSISARLGMYSTNGYTFSDITQGNVYLGTPSGEDAQIRAPSTFSMYLGSLQKLHLANGLFNIADSVSANGSIHAQKIFAELHGNSYGVVHGDGIDPVSCPEGISTTTIQDQYEYPSVLYGTFSATMKAAIGNIYDPSPGANSRLLTLQGNKSVENSTQIGFLFPNDVSSWTSGTADYDSGWNLGVGANRRFLLTYIKGGVSTTPVYVDTNGRLGIGGVNAQAIVDIYANQTASNMLYLQNTNTTYGTLLTFPIGYVGEYGSGKGGTIDGINYANLFRASAGGNSAMLLDINGDYPIAFATNGIERFRVSSAGATLHGTFNGDSMHLANGATIAGPVGIGTTTSYAWSSAFRAIQIGGTGAIFSSQATTSGGELFTCNNTYYDGAWKNISDAPVSFCQLTNGAHSFYCNASPGAAGTAFTPTQIMAITTTGVGIGTTAPTTTLSVNGSLSVNAVLDDNTNYTAASPYTIAATDMGRFFGYTAANQYVKLPDPTTCAGRILFLQMNEDNSGVLYSSNGAGGTVANVVPLGLSTAHVTASILVPSSTSSACEIISNGVYWRMLSMSHN
jgi:hypothetical protein